MSKQLFVFLKGFVSIAEGLVEVLSLGLIYPDWTTKLTGYYLIHLFDDVELK